MLVGRSNGIDFLKHIRNDNHMHAMMYAGIRVCQSDMLYSKDLHVEASLWGSCR